MCGATNLILVTNLIPVTNLILVTSVTRHGGMLFDYDIHKQ